MNNYRQIDTLKMDIIHLLTEMNDLEQLSLLYQKAKSLQSENIKTEGQQPPVQTSFEQGKVEIRENVSIDDIFKEQQYRHISYQEFRALADELDWEHSLEELLENLD